MTNRFLHKKLCKLNNNSASSDKYENHYTGTLNNSVPSSFRTLNLIGPFLQLFTLLKSVNIQATSYADKYLRLTGESFNNKTLNK